GRNHGPSFESHSDAQGSGDLAKRQLLRNDSAVNARAGRTWFWNNGCRKNAVAPAVAGSWRRGGLPAPAAGLFTQPYLCEPPRWRPDHYGAVFASRANTCGVLRYFVHQEAQALAVRGDS